MVVNIAADQQGFTSNVFLVPGERTVLVDAGDEFDAVAAVREAVDDAGPGTVDDVLEAVVLTHTHPDHVGNLAAVADTFGVDVWGLDQDHDLVDHAVDDGDTVLIGDHEYRALHTPGHKDDHLCFYAPDPGVLFAGDLVFAGGSFGRTDLPGGNRQTLVESIEYVLDTVDESLGAVHAGHGPSVTEDARDHVEAALRGAQR
jgi:glyoxylase-like metal-dependent hydrolase (beta-lactamase superfamily II)